MSKENIEAIFNLANERWNRKGTNDPIKASTMKSYKSAISKLITEINKEDDNDFDWVFSPDKVIDHISKSSRSDNSKKTIYSYLEIFLRGLSPDWQGLPELQVYKDEKKRLQDIITQTAIDNKAKTGMSLTNNQVANLIEKKDIEVFLKTLKNQIKEIHKKDDFTNDDLRIYTIYMLINTWLRIPVRNEIWNLKLWRVRNVGFEGIKDTLSKDNNYLLITPKQDKGKEAHIIRNVYKTADSKKSGGTKEYEMKEDLFKMYRKYFKTANIYQNSVFPYFDKYEDGNVEVSRLISQAFHKETGKNVASTLLMKIFFELSEEGKDVLEYIKWISYMRGTSMDVLGTNYL